MATQRGQKLNWLMQHLPEGLPVDAAWLRARGYDANLLRKYVASGWLQQPVHGVYVRPRGELIWQHVVISLQALLERDLVVGGRTALDLGGYSHFLSYTRTSVVLYGPSPPPSWLGRLNSGVEFQFRSDRRLFDEFQASTSPHTLASAANDSAGPAGTLRTPWGSWSWPLVISSPERAILEVIDDLPDRATFDGVEHLIEGLQTLSPRRLQPLLNDCRSIKVKRLFLLMAERHNLPWFKHLDLSRIDLGRGKRALYPGGRYDKKYMITIPADSHGLQ